MSANIIRIPTESEIALFIVQTKKEKRLHNMEEKKGSK
jgi:hypothetical protein